MEERIGTAIQSALTRIGAPGTVYSVERPAELVHGDYSTNAALVAAKTLGKNPRDIAQELAGVIAEELGAVALRVEAAGPGFVNITLARAEVVATIAAAAEDGWGRSGIADRKRVIVEYTDPNPFKEMHIGHMMSNVIGESVARLIENEGATVVRANYQGDVGPHVAKALWGLRKAGVTDPGNARELGEAYAEGSRAYEESPDAKTEIDQLNVALYEKEDAGLLELWRKGREVSLAAFEQVYRILGTKFDYYFFESETAESGARIVRDGLAQGIFEESEGAVIYRGEKRGLHTLVFITSRGTPTYETKDIGLAFLKEEKVPSDRSIIITAAEQTGHFKVMLAALEDIAPLVAAKTEHVPHGFLRLTSGKMSSREGNVITAADLLEDIIEKAAEKNPDPLIAEQVAVGAIKYMVLRQAPGSDILFDPERSLSLDGDSGPYLQYALVRARKILAYAAGEVNGTEEPSEPYAVERIILHYPEVAARAAKLLSPNLLTTYLTELAGAWNAFYATEQVLGSVEEAYKQRMARAFVATMEHGLSLLGIPAPERM